MTAFHRFAGPLKKAIAHRLRWTTLRPVQEQAAGAILDGNDVVIVASTASGKSEAATFPALSLLLDRPPRGVGILYVAPLRALLNDQSVRMTAYAEMVGMRAFVWHGETPAAERERFLAEPADILLTTPEAIEAMFLSRRVAPEVVFADLRVVVVDEVHAFAGTDRGAHLTSLLERLVSASGSMPQRVGLSATVAEPEALLAWLAGTSPRRRVVVAPELEPPRIDVAVVCRADAGALASEAAAMTSGKKTLVFCQSRMGAEDMARGLRQAGARAFVHHGSVSREGRSAAEARFRHDGPAAIVCTSTLELGLDIGDLDHVAHEDAPATVSSFWQRGGRAGRRPGHRPNMTFLCHGGLSVLRATALVELAREGWIEPIRPDTRCWPVLAHQVVAMAVHHGTVDPNTAWQRLRGVHAFRDVSCDEFAALLRDLVAKGYLFHSAGKLSVGDAAERTWGRRSFRDFCSVFLTRVPWRVVSTTGDEVGTLDGSYALSLECDHTFLLGGRAWVVRSVDEHAHVVTVARTTRAGPPSWRADSPMLLGFELCDQMKSILLGSAQFAYHDARAAESLEELRAAEGPLLRSGGLAFGPDDVVWVNYAGGRVNQTLKYALSHMCGWRVWATNLAIRIERVRPEMAVAGLIELARPGFWERLGGSVAGSLPIVRVSRFLQLLPPAAAREVVASHLLDIERTSAVMTAWAAGSSFVSPPRAPSARA
ncbi:MAG: DEAD/DEAH box helicase [Myxococcota bacterium]